MTDTDSDDLNIVTDLIAYLDRCEKPPAVPMWIVPSWQTTIRPG